VVGINWYAIDRTDGDALWFIEVAYAFGAQVWINFIDHFTLINCFVGTCWFADIAIDTFFGDF
jgi:hypothetical protein